MTMRIEHHGAVAHLVLARPERLSALTPDMLEQLGEATLALQKEAGVRAVVLRGEGRAFCAGADVGTMTGFDVVSGRARIHRAQRVIAGLANLDMRDVRMLTLTGGTTQTQKNVIAGHIFA